MKVKEYTGKEWVPASEESVVSALRNYKIHLTVKGLIIGFAIGLIVGIIN